MGSEEAPDRSLFEIKEPPMLNAESIKSLQSSLALTFAVKQDINSGDEDCDQNVDTGDDNDSVSASKTDRVENARKILKDFVEHIERHINDPNILSALESMDKVRRKTCHSKKVCNTLVSAVHTFARETVGISGGGRRHAKKNKNGAKLTGSARLDEAKLREEVLTGGIQHAVAALGGAVGERRSPLIAPETTSSQPAQSKLPPAPQQHIISVYGEGSCNIIEYGDFRTYRVVCM